MFLYLYNRIGEKNEKENLSIVDIIHIHIPLIFYIPPRIEK
jgi:hypothetical protein